MEQGETQAGELAPPPAMTTTICSTEDFLAGGKLPAEVGTDEELQSPPKQKQFNSAGMTGAASTATQQVPPPALTPPPTLFSAALHGPAAYLRMGVVQQESALPASDDLFDLR